MEYTLWSLQKYRHSNQAFQELSRMAASQIVPFSFHSLPACFLSTKLQEGRPFVSYPPCNVCIFHSHWAARRKAARVSRSIHATSMGRGFLVCLYKLPVP